MSEYEEKQKQCNQALEDLDLQIQVIHKDIREIRNPKNEKGIIDPRIMTLYNELVLIYAKQNEINFLMDCNEYLHYLFEAQKVIGIDNTIKTLELIINNKIDSKEHPYYNNAGAFWQNAEKIVRKRIALDIQGTNQSIITDGNGIVIGGSPEICELYNLNSIEPKINLLIKTCKEKFEIYDREHYKESISFDEFRKRK